MSSAANPADVESDFSIGAMAAIKQKRKLVRRRMFSFSILFALLLFTALLSCLMGRYTIPLHAWLQLFIHGDLNSTTDIVLLRIRFPRILAGMLIGAATAVSGASYQGMFRNPMVSPDILGASAGAALGAATGILFGYQIVGIQLAAFIGGLIAVLLTYTIATRLHGFSDPVLILVLVGVVVTSAFSACIALIKTVADPDSKLPAVTFWLMGSLSSIHPNDTLWLLIVVPLAILPLFLLRWRLNVLTLGDEDARTLGINVSRLRLVVIVCATLLTATSVAIAGPVAWIGLVMPHLARMLVGPNYKYLLPASIMMGAIYLLIVDDLSRSLFAAEIPLSILTAVLGAPFFLLLLWKTGKERSHSSYES